MKNGISEVSGMVIKSMPVGERNKRVTLLTLESGKLSFFVRGAEKPGNPFMGLTRPFSYGKFRVIMGNDANTLESAEISNYFTFLTDDMELTCYGAYFLELADWCAHEYAPEPALLRVLYRALTALGKPAIPRDLVRRIFELRTLVIDGAYDPEPPLRNAELCRYTWNHIISAPEEKLFTFTVTDEILAELSENVDASLKRFVDRKMNSLEILKQMTELRA